MYSRQVLEYSTDVEKSIAQAKTPKNTLQSLLGRAPWKNNLGFFSITMFLYEAPCALVGGGVWSCDSVTPSFHWLLVTLCSLPYMVKKILIGY
jgi:polysaccharide pyruvyl transferase WcaK-like protein